jgi:thiosulfate reductase cytochrome b subunit
MGYEWFKFSHFVAALIFVLFLFFHCDHTLTSWYVATHTQSSIKQH